MISTENRTDLGLRVAAGRARGATRRGGDRESLGTQINEKSLRILATDLRLGERAEAYLRFPAGAQNLLTYRTLRVWMRGRGPGWEEGDLQAFLKLGSDNDNFYLYRAPRALDHLGARVRHRSRGAATAPGRRGEPLAPGRAALGGGRMRHRGPGAYVACDGPYLVHVARPGDQPAQPGGGAGDLRRHLPRAAQAVTTRQVELWVDDVRLGDPVSQTGTAAAVDARLAASDVGRCPGRLRAAERAVPPDQRRTPRIAAPNVLQLAGNLRLDRFLPTSLGLAMPLTRELRPHRRSIPSCSPAPTSAATRCPGSGSRTRGAPTVTLAIRRRVPGKSWLTKGLVDPLSVAASFTTGRALTELSEAQANDLHIQR